MTKTLLTIVALLALAPLAQASPTASCSARCAYRTGTTCTAPAYVHVDCIGDGTNETRDSDASVRPFHDLQYKIDYGDSACKSGQGTWPNSDMGASRNVDFTPIGAHVYECAGTFNITTQVTDSRGVTSQTVDTVTVESEDAGWVALNTRCVANGTTPIAGQGGCPAGVTSLINSSDFDATLQTGAGKRTLYKCGDTFRIDSSPTLTPATANGSLMGGYGSCAGNPVVVNYSGTEDLFSGAVCCFNTNTDTGQMSGWRVRDINFIVSGASGGADETSLFAVGAQVDNFMLLRVGTLNVGGCSRTSTEFNRPFSDEMNAWVSYRCDLTVQDNLIWRVLYGSYKRSALIDIDIRHGGPGVSDSAGSRLMEFDHSIIAHSRWRCIGNARCTIQFRSAAASTNRKAQYSLISDVRMEDDGIEGIWSWVVCAQHGCNQDPDANRDTNNFIFENIHGVYGPSKTKLPYNIFIFAGKDMTVRNNVIDLRGVTSENGEDTYLVALDHENAATLEPDNFDVYNNTVIRARTTDAPFYFLNTAGWAGSGQGTGVGHRVRNNLVYDLNTTSSNKGDATGTAGASSAVIKTNNLHLSAQTDGCPFAGTNDACALSPVSLSQNFNEFKIRSSGGSRAAVVNRGFTFPESARKAYIYRDSSGGCRGSATGGPDNQWDVGAMEAGSTTCVSGGGPGAPAALAPPTLLAPQ